MGGRVSGRVSPVYSVNYQERNERINDSEPWPEPPSHRGFATMSGYQR